MILEEYGYCYYEVPALGPHPVVRRKGGEDEEESDEDVLQRNIIEVKMGWAEGGLEEISYKHCLQPPQLFTPHIIHSFLTSSPVFNYSPF